jgi:protein-L-isoaspartate(D-aspartate) O-methyltransferase
MSKRYRQALVRQLERDGLIRSAPVRDAFLRVPRESFIQEVADEQGIAAVYRDEAYPTKTDAYGGVISSSSQPGVMASMLEQLHISGGHRVLEIGAGTGYNASLLSILAGREGRVTSIEIDPDVARRARRAVRSVGERATIVAADGRFGWEANAPYDRIIATASSLDVPRSLRDQLKEGGLLVIPLRLSDTVPFRQVIVTFERIGRRLRSVSVIHGGFMRMRSRPDDPSLPWPVSEVVETREGDRRVLASLSGSTWGGLSVDERARLLSLLLSKPRSRPIRMRVKGESQWGLESFLALAVPEEQLVGCTRAEIMHLLFFATALPAIIDVRGPLSLAHLGGSKTISRIEAYGASHAERLLEGAITEWRRRGKPDVSRLNVEVAYGHSATESKAWRTRRRGSCLLMLDWR